MNATAAVVSEEDDDWDSQARPPREFEAGDQETGVRLDRAVATWIPDVSRSRLQSWIEDGAVTVNGQRVRPRHILEAGDRIAVEPQESPESTAFKPEAMPLSVVFEDDQLIVIDKPPGLVVHPAAGHWSGTLLNGLLAFAPELARLPRAGIVHRLDADTSGLLVVARTEAAQLDLVRQLQARTVEREYWAIVLGSAPPSGTVDAAIGRDRRDPKRFRVSTIDTAKPARTHYARLQQSEVDGATFSWLACRLETGRTHQIRVHLEHLGLPLIGDPVYRRRLPGLTSTGWRSFPRQALHAHRLGLVHPATRQPLGWTRPPPADLSGLMLSLGFDPEAPARKRARRSA